MKSIAIVPNGSWVCSAVIGRVGTLDWVVLGLVLWQVAHPFTVCIRQRYFFDRATSSFL